MSQEINIQDIQTKLTASLKDLYTKSQKADEILESLQKDKKGNFTAIFQQDSGFNARANRFLPYLVELSDEVQSLPIMESENQVPKIQQILIKIKLMHEVLSQFHSLEDAPA
ncbi:hypothetical protein M3P05_02455 [Sansalvadorimonas sp. 2012CJ34-2]|uniref:Prephenate dehydrogenase n=1 Tax=Parendozoicomonas callyspongiae TaxID=2942213 RepID=A0ABT0PCQ0_9GAMM|nr:hypothetical protein [Sansalvadorimonas sp. 2012CJ34-2]MCL6268811.1 hypothetical protein [Sansalvadorimonas sp. 2012CJ34-2]